ncbi:MAG: hypothetical protein QGG25_01440 [Phycisphaerae bacterium]|nr:hypothetical protein [Phycisphaerae bacterium]
MAETQSITEQLASHCLEDQSFLQVLLNTGALPEGWAARYLELLAIAKTQYADKDLWPRQFAEAAYCVSVYCPKRYSDWQRLTGGGINLETEQTIREIRWAADDLLFRSSGDTTQDAEGPARRQASGKTAPDAPACGEERPQGGRRDCVHGRRRRDYKDVHTAGDETVG